MGRNIQKTEILEQMVRDELRQYCCENLRWYWKTFLKSEISYLLFTDAMGGKPVTPETVDSIVESEWEAYDARFLNPKGQLITHGRLPPGPERDALRDSEAQSRPSLLKKRNERVEMSDEELARLAPP